MIVFWLVTLFFPVIVHSAMMPGAGLEDDMQFLFQWPGSITLLEQVKLLKIVFPIFFSSSNVHLKRI
jgi:hypothetical protein